MPPSFLPAGVLDMGGRDTDGLFIDGERNPPAGTRLGMPFRGAAKNQKRTNYECYPICLIISRTHKTHEHSCSQVFTCLLLEHNLCHHYYFINKLSCDNVAFNATCTIRAQTSWAVIMNNSAHYFVLSVNSLCHPAKWHSSNGLGL